MNIYELIYTVKQSEEKLFTITNNLTIIENEFNELQELLNWLKATRIKWIQYTAKSLKSICSLCLKSIFGENYDVEMKIEKVSDKKYNCKILMEKDGIHYDPQYEIGGGPSDVISLGLRIGFIILENRKILILDEPLKFLSKDKRNLAAQLFKTLYEKLNINIICITHDNELIPEQAEIIMIQ